MFAVMSLGITLFDVYFDVDFFFGHGFQALGISKKGKLYFQRNIMMRNMKQKSRALNPRPRLAPKSKESWRKNRPGKPRER